MTGNITQFLQSTSWYFLKSFVPLAAISVAVVIFLALGKADIEHERLLAEERNLVQVEKNVLEASLAAHISDAAFLATVVGHTLQESPEDGLASPQIRKIFSSFAKTSSRYSQHRILGKGGQEKLRINCNPICAEVVLKDALQSKAHRDYFFYSISQKPGDVYVSQLDLNREHGEIEKPFNPTLRLASAIAEPDGKNAGVVVLNFKGKALLDRMRQAASQSDGSLLLVTGDGHWIIGPSADVEWGHSIEERAGHVFSKTYPAAWKQIVRSSQGQFETKRGLYTFAKTIPRPEKDSLIKVNSGVPGGWIIVSHVTADALAPSGLRQVISVTSLFLLILALICWFWAASKVRHQRSSMELRKQEQMVSAISKSSRDAIAMVDDQDNIVFWNPSAENMFGYTSEEARKGKLHQLIAPEFVRQQILEGFQHFSQTGHGAFFEKQQEYTAIRRDGSEIPVEVSAAAMQHDGKWFAVGSMRDITERKQAEKRLLELATLDGLTGVANRRHFTELAQAEINRTQRYGGHLSLIMFDVDHFKKVNDTYGHDAGDEVLKALCQTAGDNIRDVDTLGRLGGEEFAVLMPETKADAAAEVAERLRSAIEKANAATSAGEIGFTISVGVTTSNGADADLANMLKTADNAMYQAKHDGRNLVRVA